MKIRDICVMSILGIVLFVAQISLAVIPNIELISLLVILFTLIYRKRIIGILCVFILIEGLTYGFGTWFLMYLYIWPLLALISYLFRNMKSTTGWAVLSGAFGLFFGALCSIVYFVIGGIGGGISYFIAGIPFDLLHCAGNFILALLLFRPLHKVLETLEKRLSRM
ncbi:MAG: hypothetical protein RSC76_05775 [Oscillospiraceae bacterium]